MEELQDAIEDAQYMDAMLDPTPKPSKEWVWLNPIELEKFINKLRVDNPSALEIETICQGCLGFYLFTKFARDQGSQILSEFVQELATLRTLNSPHSIHHIRSIISNYLADGSKGNTNFTRGLPSLARHVPANAVDKATINELYSSYGSNNALGITGDVVRRLNSRHGSSKQTSSSTIHITVNASVFDEIDAIVFHILKQRHLEAFVLSPDYQKYFQFISMSQRKLSEENDFLVMRVVGRGGFGQVNACKKATTGKLYGMKMMSKRRIKLKKAEKMCLTERDIMTTINSPYVVCLKYSFANASDLYLILDLMIGGDLGYHLGKKMTFSLSEAKFYAARILLGLVALHECNIVYRDLKPENILMDVEGYTKISDLGLACKMEPGGITGTCGTRGYWAPEMLRKTAEGKRERYTLSVDWFSLGCVIYEFLVGVSPFRTDRAKSWGNDKDSNNKSIKEDKDKCIDLATVEMTPDYTGLDEQSVSLLSGLLSKSGKDRLGAQNYQDIIEHAWFGDIKWDTLNTDKPPMKPGRDINVATQSEIGGFSDAKATKKIALDAADQKLYENWDFTSMSAFQEEIVEFLGYEEIKGPIKPPSHDSGCCCVIS